METELPPNNTLYLNNLNEKVALNEMKQTLFLLFSKFGKIIDIRMKKNILMRGQAFIIFENQDDAVKGRQELQDFVIYKKSMKVQYAKARSDVIAERDADFVKPVRKKKILKNYWNSELYRQRLAKKGVDLDNNPISNQFSKLDKQKERKEIVQDHQSPHKILFIKDLPGNLSTKDLQDVFSAYPGFVEVRYIPSKNVAFAEYNDETQSSLVINGLNGKEFREGKVFNISYSKK